jgi:hypothetical protein
MWGYVEGDDNGTNGISIGWDMDNNASNYTYNYQSVGGGWFNTGKMNLIGININATGGPTQAPVTFNVDLNAHIRNGEFHPGTDKVDVVGFATWTGNAEMTDADGDGIYTVTVDGLPVAKNLEYKYRVNGVEEAYPTTGNLHRNYVIRYWNILNNRFNNGVTTGIPTESLTSSFSVYPNPTSGQFSISLTTKAPSTLNISLVDMQGRVIYNNVVENVTSHNEIIDTPLAKGVYFVRVNNGAEVKVEKVVVR